MHQISFGQNKEARDKAYSLLLKSGSKSRRWTLRNQIMYGSYIKTIYFCDVYDDCPAEIWEQIQRLSDIAEKDLPHAPRLGGSGLKGAP